METGHARIGDVVMIVDPNAYITPQGEHVPVGTLGRVRAFQTPSGQPVVYFPPWPNTNIGWGGIELAPAGRKLAYLWEHSYRHAALNEWRTQGWGMGAALAGPMTGGIVAVLEPSIGGAILAGFCGALATGLVAAGYRTSRALFADWRP